MTYRDLSAFFVKALWARRGWSLYPHHTPTVAPAPASWAWAECCTNGRCNSCK